MVPWLAPALSWFPLLAPPSQAMLYAMVPPKVVPHLRRGDMFVEPFEKVTILFSE